MSNTAEVTPYVDIDPSVGTYVGTATKISSALFSRSATDRTADEQLAEQRRVARLSCSAVTLVGNDLAPLIRAATELGYAPVKAAEGCTSARFAQSPSRVHRDVQLVNDLGERLSMLVDGPSIRLEGSGSQAVVRQRTLAAVSRHLQQMSGGRATSRRSQDGSLHLTATELPARNGDGNAKVAVIVDAVGNVKVDIENVRGQRCERLLGDIAKAVGGKVRNKKLKPSYYEAEPGETARKRTRI